MELPIGLNPTDATTHEVLLLWQGKATGLPLRWTGHGYIFEPGDLTQADAEVPALDATDLLWLAL
jgi:hypothetical protein